VLCILKVIERLSNSLMLIISSQFAGSRMTFTSRPTVHIFRVGCEIHSVMLFMSRCLIKQLLWVPLSRGMLPLLNKPRNLVSWFSRKLIKNYFHQMSDFKANMHQIRFRLGSAPDPAVGAYSAPQAPSWI